MRPMTLLVVLLALASPAWASTPLSQSHPPAAPAGKDPSVTARSSPQPLVGRWRAAPLQVLLSSELDTSVFGENAQSTRNVELVVQPTGQATLTVTQRVIDARRRAVPGTTTIDRIDFTLGDLTRDGTFAAVPRYETNITKAVRRYPDLPQPPSELDGIRIEIIANDEDHNRVDVTLESDEEGATFSEPLRRVPAPAARRGA